MVTGALKTMLPLVILMVSFSPGKPAGDQLLVLNQSLETEPVQLKVDAHSPSQSRKKANIRQILLAENRIRLG